MGVLKIFFLSFLFVVYSIYYVLFILLIETKFSNIFGKVVTIYATIKLIRG